MISLNYRDSKPIYEQIKDNITRLIISGGLPQDEKLPSVRELAGTLAINPNTIQRAYRELENEGFIYTVPGKGSFINQKNDVESARMRDTLLVFDKTVAELLLLGLNEDQLKRRIDTRGGQTA